LPARKSAPLGSASNICAGLDAKEKAFGGGKIPSFCALMVPHTCGILFHCLLRAFDKNLRRLECNECKIGRKEHDRSDDDSDAMSQGDASSVVQNKIGRKQRYLL
jgi:hypothetical protein